MIMWTQTYLRGETLTLTWDQNLKNQDFDNKLGSLQVLGLCCWEVYTEPDFAGKMMKFSLGKYESSTQLIDVFKTASSAKMVMC